MKIRKLCVYQLLVVVLLFLFGSCATDKVGYRPTDDEEFFGIWINDKQQYPQKFITFPDMTWEYYNHTYDIFPKAWGTAEFYKKWTDNQGNIWYQSYVTYEGYGGNKQYSQELERIYRDGKVWVLEYIYEPIPTSEFDPDKFPAKMDPEHVNYHIFYRYAVRH
jgi:hypothetical protein